MRRPGHLPVIAGFFAIANRSGKAKATSVKPNYQEHIITSSYVAGGLGCLTRARRLALSAPASRLRLMESSSCFGKHRLFSWEREGVQVQPEKAAQWKALVVAPDLGLNVFAFKGYVLEFCG